MKLSIITVNLNNKEGLQRTIDSVLSQTFCDFEWIVVDGGSVDGSRFLLDQYTEYITRWVSEPDSGVFNAMNKGVRMARGEYVQFINSGDAFYNNDALRVAVCNGLTADIVFGNCLIESPIEGDTITTYPNLTENLYNTNKLFVYGGIPHPSTFIRRGLLLEDPYDETLKFVSDWKFCLKKRMEGKSFKYINETIGLFSYGGMSIKYSKLADRERLKVLEEELHIIL